MDRKATEQKLQTTLDSKYRNKSPLRTLYHLFDGERSKMVLIVILFIIKQSPVWALPILIGEIISKVTSIYNAHAAGTYGAESDARGWIIFYFVVLLVLIVQNVPMHTLYATVLSSKIRQIQLTLRSALVVRLQQLSMSFHDNTHSGKLQSKVLRDVDAVEGVSRMIIETLLQSAIIIAVASATTLRKAPIVTVFFLATVPAAVLLTRIFGRRMKKQNAEFRQEVEDMSGRVAEMIEMMSITRAHAVEGTEVDKLHRQLLRIRHAGQQLDTANNLFQSSAWATFRLFELACLAFNVWQCYMGWIDVGSVVMFQGLFSMVVNMVGQVLNVFPQLTSGIESIRSIGEVLESPDVEKNDGKNNVTSVKGELVFEHAQFQYPGSEKASINDLNLHVKAGECIAVVGESGSGKSTLMNLIIGFIRPTGGRILLDGVDMSTINFRSFRRFLAVVPQQTVLFNGTIRDNITYGLEHVTEDSLKNALEMANCDFVAKLPKGLDTPIGSRGGKLSGGQRQRIAIARALLRNPRIIILDEATSALDLHSEHVVQQAINRLIEGRTTFIVAHRLSTIRHADRIVVMKDGRMQEVGTHDELLSRSESAFSKLHALQV